MSKISVTGMAEEFGITPDEVTAMLRSMDLPVRGPNSPLTDDQVARVRARWERGYDSLHTFVPDAQYRVDLALSDGDFVCVRGMIIGTAVTGQRFDKWYLSLLEIRDGLILTEWALVS